MKSHTVGAYKYFVLLYSMYSMHSLSQIFSLELDAGATISKLSNGSLMYIIYIT